MRTQVMIMLIVLTIFLAAIAVAVGLIWWLGWVAGLVAGVVILAVVWSLYRRVIRPWHLRWGATDEEVSMAMPGDELIPDAGQATRAISIHAAPEKVWPWLVQLGWGKAGWYSYDWIDNDFKPSANRILPDYQSLHPGEKILMMPTMGFIVKAVHEPRSIVSVLEDGSTSWSLCVYPSGNNESRLVSRWRPRFENTPASVMMNLLADPGTFIMEQKMLRTIKDRVEAAA